MDGDIQEDECLVPYLNLVLMGRSGNGKSATGNSILGKPAFKSGTSLSGVTTAAERGSTTLTNGDIVNVIDTPGVLDSNVIEKVLELAENGIHAVLLVLSIRGRFSEEEFTAIESLQKLFGPKLTEYVIVVFTGSLEDESLEDYLGSGPEPLQRILQVCKNRSVLFDNKAKNESIKAMQLERLMAVVDKVMQENGGQPYTEKLYTEFRQEEAKLQQLKDDKEQDLSELNEVLKKSYDEHQKQMTGMEQVESRLMATKKMLNQQLDDEVAARLAAEQAAQSALEKSKDEICKLSQCLELAQHPCGQKQPMDVNRRRCVKFSLPFECAIL